MFALALLWSSTLVLADPPVRETVPVCDRVIREMRVATTPFNPAGFFRTKPVVGCTTPISLGDRSVTGCEDGSLRILNASGMQIGEKKLETDPDGRTVFAMKIVRVPGEHAKLLVSMPERGRAFLVDDTMSIRRRWSCVKGLTEPMVIGDQAVVLCASDARMILAIPQIKMVAAAHVSPTGKPIPAKTTTYESIDLPKPFFALPLSRGISWRMKGRRSLLIFSDEQGRLVTLDMTGETKAIGVSAKPLSPPVLLLDGRVMVIDADWNVIFYDLAKSEKTVLPLNPTSDLVALTKPSISQPVPLSDERIAFRVGKRVYFYSLKTHAPIGIYDFEFTRRAWFLDGSSVSYVSDPNDNVNLFVMKTESGEDRVLVSTRGGVVALNPVTATAAAVYRVPEANTMVVDNPVLLAEGGWIQFGLSNGVDQVRFEWSKQSDTKMPSGVFLKCQ